MQLSVLLGLAALWIVVLAPDLIRRRAHRRPTDSIASFSKHMSVLESSQRRAAHRERLGAGVARFGARPTRPSPLTPLSAPVAPLVPLNRADRGARPAPRTQPSPPARPASRPSDGRTRSFAQQRRQDVIVSLLAASLLSFLAMLTFSGLFLVLHIAIDIALVAYVAAVLTITRRTQARSQVTYLPHARMERLPNRMMPLVAQQQRRSAAR